MTGLEMRGTGRALGQAMAEVETALTLLAPSGYTRVIHEEYNIARLNDLVYIFGRAQDCAAGDVAGHDDLRPEFPQGLTASVQIFAGGRRCVNRRRVVDNGAEAPDGIERRRLERRTVSPSRAKPPHSDRGNSTEL